MIDARCAAKVRVAESGQQRSHTATQQLGYLLFEIPLAPVPEVARRRVAVRDVDRVIGKRQAFDERARRGEQHVRARTHAKAGRRARVQRKERPVRAAAVRDRLQERGAQLVSRKRTVRAAIVEERVDGRIRIHPMEDLDDALGAAVRREILVRERDAHARRSRASRTRTTKSGSTRWRRHRWGSRARRQSHSRPTACTIAGGAFAAPAR